MTTDSNNIIGLCAVYWKDNGVTAIPLNEADIKKILNANYSKWEMIKNDDLYIRWKCPIAGSTYRKLDYRLCIFMNDFAEWAKSDKLSDKDKSILSEILK